MWLWRELDALHEARCGLPITDLFAVDPQRARGFSVEAEGLLLDYSRTLIDAEVREALLALARAAGVEARREAMFAGEKINESEGRAVLHTALRAPEGPPLMLDGADIRPGIAETLARMERFSEELRAGRIRPPKGGRFSDVVNIGIGGSDLGPAMAVRALAPWADGPRIHFISNVDAAALADVLAQVSLRSTLFVVASKTFTTAETMTNAESLHRHLAQRMAPGDVTRHLVAISSATERAVAFGVAPERIFGFGDWVGGRYSLWGPIGLSLMLAVGPAQFRAFLAGGAAMDAHFRSAPLAENLPVMLALAGIWHRQVCGYPSRAVIPYEARLALLPAYLQQLEMESNGKSVGMDGRPLPRPGAPVVWGTPGTDAQHAYFQALHQGADVVPVEFLAGAAGHEPEGAHHHRLLLANCLAQAEALMRGRGADEVRARLKAEGLKGEMLETMAEQRAFPGSRPSLTLLYPRLTPYALGQLLALWEHRVFVEGTILGLNSFDQWGVELGKELAASLLPLLAGPEADAGMHDATTQHLAAWLRRNAER